MQSRIWTVHHPTATQKIVVMEKAAIIEINGIVLLNNWVIMKTVTGTRHNTQIEGLPLCFPFPLCFPSYWKHSKH